jgi:hypothetical protein
LIPRSPCSDLFSLAFTRDIEPPAFGPESGSLVLIALGKKRDASSAPLHMSYPRDHPLRLRLISHPDDDDFLGKYRLSHACAREPFHYIDQI